MEQKLFVSARKSWFLPLKNVKNLLSHYELNIFSFYISILTPFQEPLVYKHIKKTPD